MDLSLTAGEVAFRDRLRTWLAEVLPTLPDFPDHDDWTGIREFDARWQRMLYDAGYGGVDWAKEWGGLGASPTEQLIFLEELTRAGAPYVGTNFVGLLHAGPTIMLEGTPEQRSAHVTPILRGEQVWCQGFSEPDAGSDLAALRTTAVRDGDAYVVNGRKLWTSFAMVADYCELLVRTDPAAAKHKGISWLILPMDSPGVSVRPLRTVSNTTEFCELILDDVRVPVANLVGAENDGWRVAMATLGFERGTAWIGDLLASKFLLERLARMARELPQGSGTAWDDGGTRRKLGRLAAEVDGLWALTLRNVSEAQMGMVPVQGASVLKLRFTENRQHLGDLAGDLLGRAALSLEDLPGLASGEFGLDRLRTLAFTIAAGTSQIQRNILAERSLGLPREPKGVVPACSSP